MIGLQMKNCWKTQTYETKVWQDPVLYKISKSAIEEFKDIWVILNIFAIIILIYYIIIKKKENKIIIKKHTTINKKKKFIYIIILIIIIVVPILWALHTSNIIWNY
jgi:hypothetical protein